MKKLLFGLLVMLSLNAIGQKKGTVIKYQFYLNMPDAVFTVSDDDVFNIKGDSITVIKHLYKIVMYQLELRQEEWDTKKKTTKTPIKKSK